MVDLMKTQNAPCWLARCVFVGCKYLTQVLGASVVGLAGALRVGDAAQAVPQLVIDLGLGHVPVFRLGFLAAQRAKLLRLLCCMSM
jgi:hypothetical protein